MSSVHAAPVELIRESERLFLQDLLTAPDGVAGLTSAPPPYDCKPFPLGGKWRGDIPKALVRRGIIAPLKPHSNRTAAAPATRPTRNRTCLLLWRLIDRSAAQRREAELSTLTRQNARGLFDDLN